MGSYYSISEVFYLLNQAEISYLVLRNYDNLLAPEMYMDGHGDVDMLCADSQKIVKLLGAQSTRKDQPPFVGDGTHYHIYVGGEKVSLDLRYVGDDYYCKEWQEDILSKRVAHNGFYVMDKENYFYSLIYHAILQKQKLSVEYQKRLSDMAKNLQIETGEGSESDFIRLLNEFMRKNGYRYTYPTDFYVPCRFHLVDNGLVQNNWKRILTHKKFEFKVKMIEFLVWVKHSLL